MQDRETAFSTDSPAITSIDADPRTFVRRLQHLLHSYPTIIPAFILLLSVALFSALAGERFFTAFNLSLVLQQITIIAIVGVAQTIVILTAGIDLSVGAIVVLATMVMGRTAYLYGVPVFLTLPAGLLVGVFCGWMNGSLISMLRLPPFIVTLGTWNIFSPSLFGILRVRRCARRTSRRWHPCFCGLDTRSTCSVPGSPSARS